MKDPLKAAVEGMTLGLSLGAIAVTFIPQAAAVVLASAALALIIIKRLR